MPSAGRVLSRCGVCQGQIERLDPTGDGLAAWWAHENHPADGHDAVLACCDESPECSHVLAEAAQRHREQNPGCVCLMCMDRFEVTP